VAQGASEHVLRGAIAGVCFVFGLMAASTAVRSVMAPLTDKAGRRGQRAAGSWP